MHPLIAYDRGTLFIGNARGLSERERRVRIGADLDDATAGVRFPGRILPARGRPVDLRTVRGLIR
jgi:hypothetical protein